VACVQVTVRTTHYTLPTTTDSTMGRGRRSDFYGEEAIEDGCQLILAKLESVGTSLQAARRQVGIFTVATLKPLVGRADSIERQNLNPYADVTSFSPGWGAQ